MSLLIGPSCIHRQAAVDAWGWMPPDVFQR